MSGSRGIPILFLILALGFALVSPALVAGKGGIDGKQLVDAELDVASVVHSTSDVPTLGKSRLVTVLDSINFSSDDADGLVSTNEASSSSYRKLVQERKENRGMDTFEESQKVREHCLIEYFHGMTQEIADALVNDIGPTAVEHLEELLYDCSFPRRDNVVAYLGFLSDGKALIDILVKGSCPEGIFGTYHVELLLPHALGHVARRGYGQAKRILLSSLLQDSNGGALYQAAQRASNKDKRLMKLAKQALLGLRECAETNENAKELLKKLASGDVVPGWMPQTSSLASNLAEGSHQIIADMEKPSGGARASTGRHENIFDSHRDNLRRRTPPGRRMAEDTSNVSHRIPLDFVNHVDLENDMTAQEIDWALASVNSDIINVDYETDVACCVQLSREGPVGTFGTPGDGLDIINTEEESRSVRQDHPVGRIKVVSYIGYCGAPVTNAGGCARIGGYGIEIVEKTTKWENIGRLIAHEYMHNAGLNHPPDNDERQIMWPNSFKSNNGITQEQCEKLHNPRVDAEMTPEVLGACPMPPPPTNGPPSCSSGTVVDFESGTMEGWTNSGSCSQGSFVVDKPDSVEYTIYWSSGAVTQLQTQVGGDHTTGEGYALFTMVGKDDVDDGECVTTSPEYYVDVDSSISLWYFFGQRDGGDDDEDYFRLELSTDSGSSWSNLVSPLADKNAYANWTEVNVDSVPAGSRVKLRLRVSDGPAASDAIEAGIDDIRICPLQTTPTCTTVDFEGDATGWISSPESLCSTGEFLVGIPEATSTKGVPTQIVDHTIGNGDGHAFFTANNPTGSAGNADVDKGVCIGESPVFDTSVASEVSIWYYIGQRDTGDDPTGDFAKLEVSTDGGDNWSDLVSVGDERSVASWAQITTWAPPNSSVKLRMQASDGSSAGDIVEMGVDDFKICSCSTVVDFEDGTAQGWTNNEELSNCSTGAFTVGNPGRIVSRGVTTQVEGDHTTGSGNALFTAPNSSNGRDDVDSGRCVVDSPEYQVDGESRLSLWYFFGQRDAGDDAGDFGKLEISYDGGINYSELVKIGDVTSEAEWTQIIVETVPAGSNVKLRLSAADGSATGDLVEAGVDDVRICYK